MPCPPGHCYFKGRIFENPSKNDNLLSFFYIIYIYFVFDTFLGSIFIGSIFLKNRHFVIQERFMWLCWGLMTFVGHFVSSPREREKRDRRGDEKEGQGRQSKMNESEETEEII